MSKNLNGIGPVARIRDGVFFITPADLPRGRHDLSRGKVIEVHRERSMIAATELLAAVGYQGFGVRELCGRAGISLAAFYRCFVDREACIFSAYERFISVLSARMTASASDSTSDPALSFVDVYLETLASDPTVARSFQVEMEALGRTARERRRDALLGLARALRARRSAWLGNCPDVPEVNYLVAIYAMRQMAADRLDASVDSDPRQLAEEARGWLGRLLMPVDRT